MLRPFGQHSEPSVNAGCKPLLWRCYGDADWVAGNQTVGILQRVHASLLITRTYISVGVESFCRPWAHIASTKEKATMKAKASQGRRLTLKMMPHNIFQHFSKVRFKYELREKEKMWLLCWSLCCGGRQVSGACFKGLPAVLQASPLPFKQRLSFGSSKWLSFLLCLRQFLSAILLPRSSFSEISWTHSRTHSLHSFWNWPLANTQMQLDSWSYVNAPQNSLMVKPPAETDLILLRNWHRQKNWKINTLLNE